MEEKTSPPSRRDATVRRLALRNKPQQATAAGRTRPSIRTAPIGEPVKVLQRARRFGEVIMRQGAQRHLLASGGGRPLSVRDGFRVLARPKSIYPPFSSSL